MGEVKVKAQLRNIVDVGLVQRGYMKPEQIRGEKVIVTDADERQEELSTALGLEITLLNRTMVTDCIIGPPLCEPLIGQLVLEELDLLVDCTQHLLLPRPESPNRPLLKLK